MMILIVFYIFDSGNKREKTSSDLRSYKSIKRMANA